MPGLGDFLGDLMGCVMMVQNLDILVWILKHGLRILAPTANGALRDFPFDNYTLSIFKIKTIRPITHYKSFLGFSHFHIILEYLPWLQNDAKMQQR